MTPPRVLLVTAALLAAPVLTSCSADDTSVATQSATAGPASESAASAPAASESATPSPVDTTTAAVAPASDCDPTSVPDGSFTGPIDLRVTGTGFSGSGFSGGTGTMSVVVEAGQVTTGTWDVTWRSRGGSEANGMQVEVDLKGTIEGQVSGPAAGPRLVGTWTLDGTAATDVAGTIPLTFSGTDEETMTVEATSCDAVTGTFIPSFNAEGAGATDFTGTAAWTGTRTG